MNNDEEIDNDTFECIAEILGEDLSNILSIYLKDSVIFIDKIAQAIKDNDINSLIAPSHTLKSSSRQFGFYKISNLAEKVEHYARGSDLIKNQSELSEITNQMYEQMKIIKPFVTRYI